jgi:hypothetical protein
MREIVTPAVNGMAADGLPYTGFLYAGVMVDAAGHPRVLEFNCRMGDPETQPIMARLKSDLVDLVEHAIHGTLDENHFYVEKHVVAFGNEAGECEIHIETHAWERKLDELRDVEPVAAQVMLCGARVTTSYDDTLSSAAPVLGKDTALPSLELAFDLNFLAGQCENSYSCAYLNTLAWTSPTTPLPTENNPRVVFERLFGDGGTAERRAAQAQRNRSILDSVLEDFNRLQQRLGPTDRVAVDEWVDSVREVERRISGVEKRSNEELPTLERPTGVPERFDEHVMLMYELQWLAFRADLTRVVTFMLGRELNFRTYPEIGVTEGHHGLSHHQDRPEQIAKYAKVGVYQAELLAWFLDKLQSTPEGDGTLLEHSLFLYGAGLSNPNTHAHVDLPLLVIGGRSLGIDGNRHLVVRRQVPMTNLLLTLLDKAGVRADTLGDSTGRMPVSGLADV